MSILVLKAGDIELNSGPNKKSHSYFSCCHWNVNSSPTWNSYLIDIVKLQHGVIIKGYNLIRSDHPSNIKRGGVGIVCITKSLRSTHCKHHIFNWMPSLWSYNKKKKGYVAVAYRCPSQNISEFCPFYLVWETCLVIYFVQNPNSPSF